MISYGFLALALALVSCGLPQPERRIVQTYRLGWNPAPPKRNPADHLVAEGVLLVNLTHAAAGFETRKIVYVQKPYELNYYSKSEWADAPSRMLHPLLVQAFERSGIWQAVVSMPTTVRGDYRVDTEGLEVRQEFLQQPSRARLSLRVQMLALPSSRVVGTRAFEAAENAPSEDAYGGAIAANRALETLVREVTDWLAACTTKSPDRRC